MLRDQRLELAGDGDVLPEREVDLDALLDGGQLELGEPGDLGRAASAELHVRERPTPEEGERLAPGPGRAVSIARLPRGARPRAERLEAREVELLGVDPDRVAGRARDDRLLSAERAAQLGEMHLERLGRGGRRIVSPQLVDEPGGGHRVVPVGQQEHGQQRSLLGRLELYRALRPAHQERSEDPEVERFTHA